MKVRCDIPVACKYWDNEKKKCSLGYSKIDENKDECKEHIEQLKKYYFSRFKGRTRISNSSYQPNFIYKTSAAHTFTLPEFIQKMIKELL